MGNIEETTFGALRFYRNDNVFGTSGNSVLNLAAGNFGAICCDNEIKPFGEAKKQYYDLIDQVQRMLKRGNVFE